MRPLFERYPKLRDRVPFEPLVSLPTPVVEKGGVWVKRDDAIGGGKMRKLEFFRPEGKVLAWGPEGSNWLRALGARGGVRIVTYPQHHNDYSRRNVPHIPGVHCRTLFGFAFRMAFRELPGVLVGAVNLAPAGGSDAVTTLGWVNAAFELSEQVARGECPRPDAVFVPLGTCGTAAGLALGFALAGLEVTVHAVRVAQRLAARLRNVYVLAMQAAWLMDERPRVARVVLEKGFYGGYGVPHPGAAEAREFFRPLELDDTYAAKAAACALARRSAYKAPLFWLTYGCARATKTQEPAEY